jgi:hypothetical protein
MTIPEENTGSKAFVSRIPRDALLVGILILAAFLSFGLGVLAGKDMGEGSGFSIDQIPLTASPLGSEKEASKPASLPEGGQIVASKNGTKYFLPWCGSAKRIKEENKIWFSSREEAEARGYEPAANCKGL